VDNCKASDDKLPYEKPRLIIIPLVAEEVLAVKCKQAIGAPGKNTWGCGNFNCMSSTGS
jgi:hypothetical protein